MPRRQFGRSLKVENRAFKGPSDSQGLFFAPATRSVQRAASVEAQRAQRRQGSAAERRVETQEATPCPASERRGGVKIAQSRGEKSRVTLRESPPACNGLPSLLPVGRHTQTGPSETSNSV